ncbi:sugar transferase [Halorussus marinus]|uniref:sugar transferase n=1 Tax=Halorussus marinus TaxID=2505976 RepID=UPI00106E404C|nr:sugar transferase [Halorussus marinus]
MVSGYRYRAASVAGTILASVLAVSIADLLIVQSALLSVPIVRRLSVHVLTTDEVVLAMMTTVAVVVGSLVPLFKPQPRRILDTVLLVQKRVVVAGLALAAIGYFDYTYRLPRTTLIGTVAVLFITLPAWFVVIRRRPFGGERAVVVGDDPAEIHDMLEATDMPVIGYISPPSRYSSTAPESGALALADGSGRNGSVDVEYLGGFARLNEVLVEYDIDTAILAFEQADRAEFFGALDTCYEHGVDAKVHRDHVDDVLTRTDVGDEMIVDVDLEPWDWQDYAFKRVFDMAFAVVGLLAFAPLILVIAVAIKMDSPGPVLYSQERTAEFGETFTVYKFRSMVTDAEAATGAKISEEDNGGVDPRVTQVGGFLRTTHLDEIPQLWSILIGDMSVVGPRPERPELDEDIQTGVVEWRKRWFIKPGLTGLAQINDVTGHEPEKKLQYDIEYVRKQSFWFDVKVVVRQVWKVFFDFAE